MPFQGGFDQLACRRARDENPRQVEQQRRVLVAAWHRSPVSAIRNSRPRMLGIADQVEGGIGRDEAVRRDTSVRDARRRRGSPDRYRPALAGAASGRGRTVWGGDAGIDRIGRNRRATGWPIAAQSGVSSSRARINASRSLRRAEPMQRLSSASPVRRSSGRKGRVGQRGPVELCQDAGRHRHWVPRH